MSQVKKIPGYVSWLAMHQRCRRGKYYVSRGISVCERWATAAVFLADMGARPEGMTLERIDNNGNYEPSNCRWATPKEQARNRRNNVLVEWQGKKLPLSEVSELSGIARETLMHRMKIGRKDIFAYGIRSTKAEMMRRGVAA